MKCNALKNLSFLGAEAQGLEVLRRAGVIGVPKVFGLGTDKGQKISFLLMETII